MTNNVCRECRREYDHEFPEKWVRKYPQLKDLCPDCVSEWIVDNVPENRE